MYFSFAQLSRDINLHNPRCGVHAILHLIEARISLPWANTKFHIPPTRFVTRFPWGTLRSREIFLLSDNESSRTLYPSVIYQRAPVIISLDAFRRRMSIDFTYVNTHKYTQEYYITATHAKILIYRKNGFAEISKNLATDVKIILFKPK